jgi:imidazolonepropionase
MLFINIKGLAGYETSPQYHLRKGKEMNDLPILSNAFLEINEDNIHSFGEMKDFPNIENQEVVDCEGSFILPTYVDSHTHLVFAASRENEFVMRIQGKTYEEIAQQGGGILNSARRLGLASEDELFESAFERLNEVIKLGTGAIEIKSGYGLSTENELKMLRVIKRLKEVSPIEIKSTFLGAHAYPREYKQNHPGYIDKIIYEMLPVIKEEGLADYIDVF